jgi:hypothetical protein
MQFVFQFRHFCSLLVFKGLARCVQKAKERRPTHWQTVWTSSPNVGTVTPMPRRVQPTHPQLSAFKGSFLRGSWAIRQLRRLADRTQKGISRPRRNSMLRRFCLKVPCPHPAPRRAIAIWVQTFSRKHSFWNFVDHQDCLPPLVGVCVPAHFNSTHA